MLGHFILHHDPPWAVLYTYSRHMQKRLLRLTARRPSRRQMWRDSCNSWEFSDNSSPQESFGRWYSVQHIHHKRIHVNLSHFASGPWRAALMGLSIWLFELHVGWGDAETRGDGLSGCSATQESPVRLALSSGWQGPRILPETAVVHTVHVVIGCPDARWREGNMVSQSWYSNLISPQCSSPVEWTSRKTWRVASYKELMFPRKCILM